MHLILNPGSTSTKMAIHKDGNFILSATVPHSQEQLSVFSRIAEQKAFRKEELISTIKANGYSLGNFQAVIGIGGLLQTMASGVYEVNQDMADVLESGQYGEHAANLGGLIGREIATAVGCNAYIADPITVDEMQDVARISGHPLFRRSGRCHTLNHKMIGREAACALGRPYEELRLIIAHLGGGISIAAHDRGQMVDTSSSRGEGAFSIDRSGAINAWTLANACYSGRFTKDEMLSMLNGQGGIKSYLQTTSFKEVEEQKNNGDALAREIFEALVYQISKEIGAMSAVLFGKIDGVVLTGGMANSQELVACIHQRVGHLGKLLIYPGENEMLALAAYLDGVMTGSIQAKQYSKESN